MFFDGLILLVKFIGLCLFVTFLVGFGYALKSIVSNYGFMYGVIALAAFAAIGLTCNWWFDRRAK